MVVGCGGMAVTEGAIVAVGGTRVDVLVGVGGSGEGVLVTVEVSVEVAVGGIGV